MLATDVVRLQPGRGFPIDALAKAIAGRFGEEGAPLAARVPALRRAVAEQLIASFARRNGAIAAAVFIPGARPARAAPQPAAARAATRTRPTGARPTRASACRSSAATAGVGFGLRAVARELLDFVPVAGWAVKGAVAYAGTRALGEATLRRLEGAPGGR